MLTLENNEQLQKELLELLEQKEKDVVYNRLNYLFPDEGPFKRELYPKHCQFMAASKDYMQRAFIAANRTGKTLCGAYEMACHLTGRYPSWWTGRRFLNAIEAWAVGISNQETKEVQQKELLGRPDCQGTGTIPKECIIETTKKPGVADAVETVYVRHISGDTSILTFKSYEQGRESFQGTKKQVIWLDEEPKDVGIYSECLTRLMDRVNPGIIFCTFTPLFGLSDVVMSFLPDGRFPKDGVSEANPHKFVTQVSWDEVPHLDPKQKEQILASYSAHEREARSRGIPSLGAGAIYPYLEDDITCDPFKIPDWWPKAYGFDVGWNRTAAVWITQDPDTRTVYAYSEHYMGQEQPVVHAHAIKARGEWITGAIDPASEGVSQVDGKALFHLYEECGLILEFADNSVEAGILKVGQMFASGQLKIFNTLQNLLSEYRTYRRDERGKIVKKKDHAMDALRYAIMTGMEFLSTRQDADFNDSYDTIDVTGRDSLTGY